MRTLAVIALLLVAACAPVDVGTPEPTPQPTPDEVAPEPEPPEEVAPEPEPEVVLESNPEVTALWTRLSDIKGYSFTYAGLPEKSGVLNYYVRGGKAKVELLSPYNMGDWNADFIYLDYDTRSATGYCIDLASCYKAERKGPVDYDDWAVKLPMQWVDEAQYGELSGLRQFNERQVHVVRWHTGTIHYEALLDNFYGLPQRVAIASDEDYANVIGGAEYQEMQTNNVKAEDVEPPY